MKFPTINKKKKKNIDEEKNEIFEPEKLIISVFSFLTTLISNFNFINIYKHISIYYKVEP